MTTLLHLASLHLSHILPCLPVPILSESPLLYIYLSAVHGRIDVIMCTIDCVERGMLGHVVRSTMQDTNNDIRTLRLRPNSISQVVQWERAKTPEATDPERTSSFQTRYKVFHYAAACSLRL